MAAYIDTQTNQLSRDPNRSSFDEDRYQFMNFCHRSFSNQVSCAPICQNRTKTTQTCRIVEDLDPDKDLWLRMQGEARSREAKKQRSNEAKKMKAAQPLVLVLVGLLALAGAPSTSASTVPAFLWSPHYHIVKAAVNYQTISPKDLAKSLLTEGGWSNVLCSANNVHQPLELALVFVGQELQSSDIPANRHADPALVDLLKTSFSGSNFSMAFPYVAAPEDDSMESSLVSEISETCGQDLGLSNVALLGSCSIEGENVQKLTNVQSFHDYLVSRMEKRSNGEVDLVVFCHKGSESSKEFDQPHSEGKVFSELVNSLDQSGAKYGVLYVSDPSKSIQYPSRRELERFLAESGSGNASANSTACDEVCLLKSSLLEGLLVGIVLLIILISGICCMMGIDTPTRFETPQES
ncbi:hypothetical protein FF2_005432 [Malus domestica]